MRVRVRVAVRVRVRMRVRVRGTVLNPSPTNAERTKPQAYVCTYRGEAAAMPASDHQCLHPFLIANVAGGRAERQRVVGGGDPDPSRRVKNVPCAKIGASH